jgi:hypothetical protein
MRAVDIDWIVVLCRVFSAGCICALGACSVVDRLSDPPSSGPVALVRVYITTDLVEPFDAAPVYVDVRDAQNRSAGSASDASWKSSDPSVVSVSRGFVEGHSPGDATVTATVNGVSGSTIVHVGWRPDTRLFIGGEKLSLDVGGHLDLSATVLTSIGHLQPLADDVVWTSSNPLTAGVDAQGRLTAFATGSTTVVARCFGLVDSMFVDVGMSKPGFAYFYSGDAIAADYDDTFWSPKPGNSFTTEGAVSASWEVPDPGQPNFGWAGPSKPARDVMLHAVSLDNFLCAAYAQSDTGFPFANPGAPLVECRTSISPGSKQSVKMELVAFRSAEFSGTLALVRPDWPATSSNAGGITQIATTANSRSYAMPGVTRDSLFWFVTAGAEQVSACRIARPEDDPSTTVVRVICDSFQSGDANPLFYAVGFGANARRGAAPIGFAEVIDGRVTRTAVDGVDFEFGFPAVTTGSSVLSVDVVVSGARLAAFDRLPAVLMTPISSNSASCSITEPYRPTATAVRLTLTCTGDVAGFTFGVVY